MPTNPPPRPSGLGWSLAAVLVMSGVVNVLALSGAVYMLQVYDRVLTSQSVPTLIALSLLVAGLYIVLGVLDVLRAQVVLRIGLRIDAEAMPRAYAAARSAHLDGKPGPEAVQPVRDADTLRGFLASPAPLAVADLPWTPVFLAFVAVLSPTLGLVTLIGMALIVAIATVTDLLTRRLENGMQAASHQRTLELDASLRSVEPLMAMGMAPEATARFIDRHRVLASGQRGAGDVVTTLSGISKVLRLILQSAILGLGAWLAIAGDMTAGAIIAASIASARALAPVEQAITNWRSLSQARAAARRLRALSESMPGDARPLELPLPTRSAALDNVVVRAPGGAVPLLAGVSLRLEAGQGLAIVGASGSGKTTLARALAAVWPVAHGAVRLDDTPIERWERSGRGRFIGYMPQHVELFPASIAENIARLGDELDSRAVIAAATAAGIHEVIVNLPQGYETRLGPGGAPLSAGQRQQVGLARALFDDPFLVVLDEPNSNLDQAGEDALIASLHQVRARGGIVAVVAHRRSILAALDTVAIVSGGRLQAIGPKAEVLAATTPRIDGGHVAARATPLRPEHGKRRTAP